MRLYRTDDREPWKIDAGFRLKDRRTVNQARSRLKKWLEDDRLYGVVQQHMTSGKDYAISTDKTREPGGYAKRFCYEMQFDETLKERALNKETLGLAPGKHDQEKCRLFMDKPTLDAASLIMVWINLAGREDEFTFLTDIPAKYIATYSVLGSAKEGFVNFLPFHGRTEYVKMKGAARGVAQLRSLFGVQKSPEPPPRRRPIQKNPALAKKAVAATQKATGKAASCARRGAVGKLSPELLKKFKGT